MHSHRIPPTEYCWLCSCGACTISRVGQVLCRRMRSVARRTNHVQARTPAASTRTPRVSVVSRVASVDRPATAVPEEQPDDPKPQLQERLEDPWEDSKWTRYKWTGAAPHNPAPCHCTPCFRWQIHIVSPTAAGACTSVNLGSFILGQV